MRTEGCTGSRKQSLEALVPCSALFRNSTNRKLFLSDHLIKQDYPDLLRV